jgi:hypothetical protein
MLLKAIVGKCSLSKDEVIRNCVLALIRHSFIAIDEEFIIITMKLSCDGDNNYSHYVFKE